MKKDNIPIKHHYIPKFFLANFTEGGKKESKLWITDLKSCKQWQAAPPAIAYQNNLYSLEIENNNDNQTDAVETMFAELESMTAPVIKRIIEAERIPSGNEFNILMNFIALMATRTPKMITQRAQFVIDIADTMIDVSFSTKDQWQKLMIELIEAGKMPADSLEKTSYEEIRDFVYSKRYTLDINQNAKVEQILASTRILVPLLCQRKWSLFLSKDITTTFPPVGGFICSDNPVAIVSFEKLPAFRSPGFGMSRTEVSMPLSKDAAIIGRFEGEARMSIISLQGMAAINSRTSMYADRFLYHYNKNFLMLNSQQQICNAGNLLSYYKQHPIE